MPPLNQANGAKVTGLTGTDSAKYGTFNDLEGSPLIYQEKSENKTPALKSSFFKTFFRGGYNKQFVKTFSVAWPLMLSTLSNYAFGPISLMFCGNLGVTELDATALAISVINIFGISVANGLGTACDTLMSQANGAGNKKLVGLYVQQGILIMTLAAMLMVPIHLNLESLLSVVGQNPEVARLAGEYVLYFLPGLLFIFLQRPVAKYLETQKCLYPSMISGLVANIFNAVLQWLFVWEWEMGIKGSAIAFAAAYGLLLFILIAYILGSKVYIPTWPGWRMECLQNWRPFLVFGIHGALAICGEWWCYEIGLILSGLIDKIQLGALSIIFNIQLFCYVMPVGIMFGTSIQIGNYLGAGNAEDAKVTAKVTYVMISVVILCSLSILFGLRYYIPLLFTSDEAVVSLAAEYMLIYLILVVFDCLNGGNHGILRGTGNQHLLSIVIGIGYMVVGLPTAIPLMFLTDLGSAGYLWGLGAGLSFQVISIIVLISRMDWNKQMLRAVERVGVKKGNSDSNCNMVKDPEDVPQNNRNEEEEETTFSDCDESDREHLIFENSKKNHADDGNSTIVENDLTVDENGSDNALPPADTNDVTSEEFVGFANITRLTTTQLIIRRLGSLIAVTGLLVTSIVLRLTVKVT